MDRAQDTNSGVLAGQVVGVKSNIRVARQAWTAGIGARAGHRAAQDAPVVALCRAAGATILSRLSMDEGALGAATDNPHFGRCENPTRPGYSAGGSSGGSAAAVAAGAVGAALGTDTLGSVRIPAAYCGVYGLKLGPDVVSMDGVMPLAPSLDALGIIAATPKPIADLLNVLIPDSKASVLTGWAALPDTCLPECTPDILSDYRQASDRMQSLFGPPQLLDGLNLAGLSKDAFVLTEHEAVSSLGDQTGLSCGLSKLIDYGRSLTPEKLAPRRARLAAARSGVCQALAHSRVLLMPTVAEPAFAHGAQPPVGQADFTALANIAGLPALAIPAPRTPAPGSIQLVGPPGAEMSLVELATRL